ncbi:MAG: PQQ-binding-like beta-propeller repeat protein [Thermoplasmata archaeon]
MQKVIGEIQELRVVSLLLIAFLFVTAAGATAMNTSASDQDEPRARALAENGWPGFGFDERNTHLSPYDTSHVDGTVKWTFNTNNWLWSSAAITGNGTVYVGSTDDKLYALDNRDGSVLWSYETDGDIISSPAVDSDGNIFFGSKDHHLYSLDSSGGLRWKYETDGTIYSSPAVDENGTVYFGSYDNYFYALNSNGGLEWKYKAESWFWSSPAISPDGTVYVGSGDKHLYAFNGDGSEKWNFSTGGFIYSSPAVDESGNVYFGSYDDRLYAIDPNGDEIWNYKTGNDVLSSPAIGKDGTVYFGSNDQSLYALDSNGAKKWSFRTGGDVVSSPAIGDDGTIYFGSYDKNIYALTSSGDKKWEHSTYGSIYASPSIGPEGDVYVGSWDSKLYAFTGNNDAPVAVIDVWRQVEVNMTVAGIPGHTVTAQFYHGDELVDEMAATRPFGPPAENSTILKVMDIEDYRMVLIYNSTGVGANPVWVTFRAGNNTETIFHLFLSTGSSLQNETFDINKELMEIMGDKNIYHFSGENSYDPDGTIVSYQWDFDDGYQAEGMEVSHEFDKGVYDIKLTVTDDKGARASTIYVLNVGCDYTYADVTLWIAGRKGNEVTAVVYEDGNEVMELNVIKDQKWVNKAEGSFKIWETKTYTLELRYHAEERGCNPVLLRIEWGDSEKTIFELFKTRDGYDQVKTYDLKWDANNGIIIEDNGAQHDEISVSDYLEDVKHRIEVQEQVQRDIKRVDEKTKMML